MTGPTAAPAHSPYRDHRNLAQVERDALHLTFDFTPEQEAAICARRQYQSATELAVVFGTTRAVIGAIVREGRR